MDFHRSLLLYFKKLLPIHVGYYTQLKHEPSKAVYFNLAGIIQFILLGKEAKSSYADWLIFWQNT